MTTKGRLDRLETVWHRRPEGCFSDGPTCAKHALVGDGSDDPPMPDLPATCAGCGRPTFWQITVVCGVDVGCI